MEAQERGRSYARITNIHESSVWKRLFCPNKQCRWNQKPGISPVPARAQCVCVCSPVVEEGERCDPRRSVFVAAA